MKQIEKAFATFLFVPSALAIAGALSSGTFADAWPPLGNSSKLGRTFITKLFGSTLDSQIRMDAFMPEVLSPTVCLQRLAGFKAGKCKCLLGLSLFVAIHLPSLLHLYSDSSEGIPGAVCFQTHTASDVALRFQSGVISAQFQSFKR